MGRQINFYMTENELADLESELLRRFDLKLSYQDVSTLSPGGMDEFSGNRYVNLPFAMFYLARLEDLSSIKYVKNAINNIFYLDQDSSHCIQYNHGITRENKIHRSRIYYITGHFNKSGAYIHRPKEFLGWGESVIRLVRKGLTKINSVENASAGAIEMQKNGYALVLW